MRKIVHDDDTFHFPTHFHAPLDAFKRVKGIVD
jgi:hypothetical protein